MTCRVKLGCHVDWRFVLQNLLSQTAEPFLDPKSPEVEIQILSDVDDTFTCSGGGLFPAFDIASTYFRAPPTLCCMPVGLLGSDQRFKRKAIYPGAAEMYLGLSLGPQPDRPKHPQGVVWCVLWLCCQHQALVQLSNRHIWRPCSR